MLPNQSQLIQKGAVMVASMNNPITTPAAMSMRSVDPESLNRTM